ncbi:MAG: CTP synthase [Thermoprotei archaeon]|nr:MAG: CTP synthase [Thermoprotei archaeon]RLF03937.1 MAG: CTP synthase [Thermoprotei archaeon]
MRRTRFVFVTGGVLSGIGKGVVSASIAKLFQFRGYSVDMVKIDPYLNVDPGTLNPIEHGEVFVCEHVWKFEPARGFSFNIAEVDQDFGTYERFLDVNMHPSNNITSGQVFLSVILRERLGEYLGKTIQVIPHITDEVKRRLLSVAARGKPDVLVVEVGGTVGDIEAMPYLEAIRQLRLEMPGRTALVHVTLVPYLETVGQQKTKPTQHSVRALQSMGLQPDVIIGRSKDRLSDEARRKISLYCSVPLEAVISDPNLDVVYELPLVFEEQGLGRYLTGLLGLSRAGAESKLLSEWRRVVDLYKYPRDEVVVAMPGKYTMIYDSYISINEALRHAAAHLGLGVRIRYIDSSKFEEDPGLMDEELSRVDCILLTPGFGSRGVEGMIDAARYALENDKVFLGICFGAQLLFVAFCRYVLGLKSAHTTEVNPSTPHPVVDLLPEQKRVEMKGGTMRLGAHKVHLKHGTRLYEAYGTSTIWERFRHRYHIIGRYVEKALEKGLVVSATDESGRIVNAIEVSQCRWVVGVQFHPEFKSRASRPSPVYRAFMESAYECKMLRKRAAKL